MVHEISPICDFLFGSIRTGLPMDTVDVELTVQMVKGIYTCRKDHTIESTIFTLWTKKVIPFPFLRHKIQAYQDDKRNETVLPWNGGNTFQFSAPPMTSRNPRKRAPDMIRVRWLSKSRYNPMKGGRPNTPEINVTDLDAIDMENKIPSPVKVCDRIGLSCSFCKQALHIPHLKIQIGQVKIGMEQRKRQGETNLLSDWDLPKPQSEPNPTTDADKLDTD